MAERSCSTGCGRAAARGSERCPTCSEKLARRPTWGRRGSGVVATAPVEAAAPELPSALQAAPAASQSAQAEARLAALPYRPSAGPGAAPAPRRAPPARLEPEPLDPEGFGGSDFPDPLPDLDPPPAPVEPEAPAPEENPMTKPKTERRLCSRCKTKFLRSHNKGDTCTSCKKAPPDRLLGTNLVLEKPTDDAPKPAKPPPAPPGPGRPAG